MSVANIDKMFLKEKRRSSLEWGTLFVVLLLGATCTFLLQMPFSLIGQFLLLLAYFHFLSHRHPLEIQAHNDLLEKIRWGSVYVPKDLSKKQVFWLFKRIAPDKDYSIRVVEYQSDNEDDFWHGQEVYEVSKP